MHIYAIYFLYITVIYSLYNTLTTTTHFITHEIATNMCSFVKVQTQVRQKIIRSC